MGRVTSTSTSSGARPDASVMIVTVGRFRSGKTSTGISRSWIAPYTMTTSDAISTMPGSSAKMR